MQAVDFSTYKIERLTETIDTLANTLIEAGVGEYVDRLLQIKLAAEWHDKEGFEKQVLSNGLFGGPGALWEIWINDRRLQKRFEKQFCEFVDQLKRMGINNTRINQVRETFNSK